MRLSATGKANPHICLVGNVEPSVGNQRSSSGGLQPSQGGSEPRELTGSPGSQPGETLQNMSHMMSSHEARWKLESSGKDTSGATPLCAEGTKIEALEVKETGRRLMLPVSKADLGDTCQGVTH